MDLNEELKFLRKFKKKNWGEGGRGRVGCDRRIEVWGLRFGGGESVRGGGGLGGQG